MTRIRFIERRGPATDPDKGSSREVCEDDRDSRNVSSRRFQRSWIACGSPGSRGDQATPRGEACQARSRPRRTRLRPRGRGCGRSLARMLASLAMGRPHRRWIRSCVLWSVSTLVLARLVVAAGDAPQPVPAAGVLVIEVSGISSPGTLHLEVYDARQQRWGDAPLRRERLSVDAGKAAEWRVEGLASGEYAVRVFLDQDGNGNLERSAKGR